MFCPAKVVIHHSLTEDSRSVSWGAIHNYHTKTLGWSAIGYHAGVELVYSGHELSYEILMGRMWDISGAHTRGHNHDSLGLCFVGNFNDVAPPLEQIIIGARILSLWLKLFNLTVDDIHAHREYAEKTCPGRLFSLKTLQSYVH